MDKQKRAFVPFAIPTEEGEEMGATICNYLDTWTSGEYFGWDYEKRCETTADIWKAIADFEKSHHSDDQNIFGFVVFCGCEEDPYIDAIWLGYFDESNRLVIDHDKATEMYNCGE